MMYPDCSSSETIQVLEQDRLLTFSYESIMNFHGGAMPAGVALAFRMFQYLTAACKERSGELPLRGNVTFFSGLGNNGQGILDTADCLYRIRRSGGLRMEMPEFESLKAPEAPGGGKYLFSGSFGAMSWQAAVRPGFIPQDFFDASKKAHLLRRQGKSLSDLQMEELLFLRRQTEKAILSRTPEELFTFTIK